MQTTSPSPAHGIRAEIERLLETETRPDLLYRSLVDRLKHNTNQCPEESAALHATLAHVLESHITSQPVCHATIHLLRNDRDNHFPESLSLSVSTALRAIPSLDVHAYHFRILLSALDLPVLRDASLEACQSILYSRCERVSTRELREFARELISFFRRCPFNHPLKESVKGIAHTIFTIGHSMPSEPEHALAVTSSDVMNNDSNQEASQILLKLFMQRPPASTLDRLTAEDFKHVGDLSGLTIEEFRVTAETLSLYAARDGGALDAFLRIAKSPHDPAVSVQTRTQALASFLATTRRRGGLSVEVERQILATSAEIPELRFISDAHETTGEASAE